MPGFRRISDEERAARFMRTQEVPCPVCGYNLRGLRDTICPECGGMFDPVELSTPAREVTLDELMQWPIVTYSAVVINVALFFAIHYIPSKFGTWTTILYGALLIALLVGWATWDGLSMYDDDLSKAIRGRPSLFSTLIDLVGFGLSRRKGADVWAPLVTLALTGVHVVLVLVIWLA